MELKIIARIHTDYKEKFGIPRQSGIAAESVGKIIFEKEYRRPEALRGIEGYSHLWLIWQFSESVRENWSPTVRPPRLGGNKKIGVFATRSPFRPNPIGLSSVELCGIEHSEEHGDILIVKGADILDGTPIYDVKPYLKYTDAHTDATGGFSDDVLNYKLAVDFPQSLLDMIPKSEQQSLITALENDPRPGYKDDGEHEYGMKYSDFEVFFKVKDCILTVTKLKT
ncbi:MAG: tRNA (N6-threonylcarbamoyladenosine(37)-N6)-methyltransferase TrmO [Ruminococcaceae bacterium]|nr:tRNA (N6-threonylcarbamoyladenosine(37)-N6)-methyltransferase TrmO [Oscillospiraceae bacterium]